MPLTSLKPYFVYFLLWLFAFTCVFGVLAALLPSVVGGVLSAMPFLIAMMMLLFRFLKREQRAPNPVEHKRLCLGLSAIFWLFNLVGILLSMWLVSQQNHSIMSTVMLYLKQPQFVATVLIFWLLLAVPLYLINYWFYGKQAQRMAKKMFDRSSSI